MPQTRSVFAIITAQEQKSILLSERADGKGWDLPGGRVEEGENNHDALIREVRDMTGLDIEVLEQIGEPLVLDNDTAIAYLCKIVGGQLMPSGYAPQHHFCTADDLKAGRIRVGEGTSEWHSLKLVGPGCRRLGRTGRMVYDGFSIMEEPQT